MGASTAPAGAVNGDRDHARSRLDCVRAFHALLDTERAAISLELRASTLCRSALEHNQITPRGKRGPPRRPPTCSRSHVADVKTKWVDKSIAPLFNWPCNVCIQPNSTEIFLRKTFNSGLIMVESCICSLDTDPCSAYYSSRQRQVTWQF